jgi:hypothetical protein
MSIGANWRQISPGEVSGAATQAGNKFAQSNAADQLSETAEGRTFSEFMFGEDGFEFTDLLDVVNPLQHIPGVGMMYRSMTGDELGNGARVVGGGLFGGVFGLAGAAIDAVVDAFTGEDTGSHIMAFVDDTFSDDSGMEVADATDAQNNAANAKNVASASGGYQGDLVLPWMAGSDASSGNQASAAEQATIVQTAPTARVDQTVLASAAAPGQEPSNSISASDLNVPWANARVVETPVANPQLQAQLQAQQPQPAEKTREVADAITDPAELDVAMASAGTVNPGPASIQSIALNTASITSARNPVRPASFSSEGGDTVWARAASSGRVSRQTSTFAISAEMAAHETKYGKLNAAKADKQQDISPMANDDGLDLASGQAPLSAAEMAARFNAALGHDKAQTMAVDAAAKRDTRAVRDQMTAQQVRSDSYDSANMQAQPASESKADSHPLMQRATSHIGSDEPVGAWFSQTMMDGLKKYQDMQKQAGPTGNAI